MEPNNLIAKAQTDIEAPADKVWDALVNPEIVKRYMFGTTISSEWKVGSQISWKGEWRGKPYEDKGVILQIRPEKLLQYSHFSPLAGLPDVPENYHTVTIELVPKGNQTFVLLTQDNNTSKEGRDHSEKNWQMMLDAMKRIIEDK